jgi:hypothetical protein
MNSSEARWVSMTDLRTIGGDGSGQEALVSLRAECLECVPQANRCPVSLEAGQRFGRSIGQL